MFHIFYDPPTVVDSVETIHYRKDGTIVSRQITNNTKLHRLLVKLHLSHNTVTISGFASTVKFLGNLTPPSAFTYIGIGTGATPAAVGDTQLQTPLKIKAASMSAQTTLNAGDTLQAVATFSSADTLSGTAVNVSEVVLANGTVNGVSLILLHQVYTPVDVMNFDQGDTLQVTVKVQAKQG